MHRTVRESCTGCVLCSRDIERTSVRQLVQVFRVIPYICLQVWVQWTDCNVGCQMYGVVSVTWE